MGKGEEMNLKEELTTLLMESYDRGVNDAKQAALIALEKAVAVAVAAEREACAKLVDLESRLLGKELQSAAAIRARGQA